MSTATLDTGPDAGHVAGIRDQLCPCVLLPIPQGKITGVPQQ